MSLFTFHRDGHRTHRNTRPGHRWLGARELGCHLHHNTDTSRNKPRNLMPKKCLQQLQNADCPLTDGAGALGAVVPHAPGGGAPGGDGGGHDGDHKDQGEEGEGETLLQNVKMMPE